MWKSWGDKYEIIPHNEEKHPRKIKGINVLWVIVIAIIYFSGRIIMHFRPETTDYVPCIIMLSGAVLSLGLFYLKWKKNDKENDFMLITIAIICAFTALLTSPYFFN